MPTGLNPNPIFYFILVCFVIRWIVRYFVGFVAYNYLTRKMPFPRRHNNKRGGRGGRHFNRKALHNRPKAEYRHQDQLTEEEVGISEYISKLDGYPAVIKARFSDFQVNEINLEGKMAKLTDISVPKSFALQQKKYSHEEITESPLEKIPQVIWDALKNLVKSTDGEPVIMETENLNKDDRKSIHTCVKSYFGQEIVASTITKDEKSILEFKKYAKGKKDPRVQWPDNTPEFVHFIVYKEMVDTMEACFKIGYVLKLSPTKITYAGVKDRRAKTSQWLCIKRYEPSKLVEKTRHLRNIHIGNIEFKENCLKIGHLKGNRFRIALRNVKADDELITKSMDHVKENGFINYYGLQRFGNDKDTPTFSIGIKLLQGQWKEAVDLILKLKGGDDLSLSINQAKKLYGETQDAEAALKLCDKKANSLEKKLLEGLAKHHNKDLVNALEYIPRNMRLMYIHAFQSYIWNKMVSKRIHEFGLKPVEGDLIYTDNSQEEVPLLDDVEHDDKDEIEESVIPEETEDPKRPSVRSLQVDELDKYTVQDIVLPLPGYDITYPENMKHYYKEAIEECGLTLEMPRQKVRTYNLSGTYRKICQNVQDFDWKLLYYNDPTDNLIYSDLEELKGEEEPKNVENGQYKAVVVSFTLNASSYATMVLRELLKCNTSSSFQAGCNDYGGLQKTLTVSVEPKKETVEINDVQPGSLLADKERYEDFKNNLFKDILGDTEEDNTTNKRELENSEESVTNNKKIKIDDEQN